MKGKVPWFARYRLSCPECGMIVKAENLTSVSEKMMVFDCPRCKAHFPFDELCDENREKISQECREE
jgi:predicted RNA-binding Zn-ribbon protein involved in translation (DUF1610 family)